MNGIVVSFEKLSRTNLIVDAIYEGGKNNNAGDDPISKIVGSGNQGGFRYVGSLSNFDIKLCVLYSEMSDPDWPDELDLQSGQFTYYGDNKRPGADLHDTKKKGNRVLKEVFNRLHCGDRNRIPPFFVFTKGPKGRDVMFRGLAVPGARRVDSVLDLVAIWRSKEGKRFQNYRAVFTILDVAEIHRAWIDSLTNSSQPTAHPPTAWRRWIESGEYSPLLAPKTTELRNKNDQLPYERLHKTIIELIVSHFKSHPEREYAFEQCAAEIVRKMENNIVQCDLTRPWRDGGRDAVGKYKIGMQENAILVEFALEAKCKISTAGSGVRDTSRLIARLRHRQFGIFVTTSYIDYQAYKEILEDEHPVILVTGRDIAKILVNAGIDSADAVRKWLNENFPHHISPNRF